MSYQETDSHPRSTREPDGNVGVLSDDSRRGSIEEAEANRVRKGLKMEVEFLDKIWVNKTISRARIN